MTGSLFENGWPLHSGDRVDLNDGPGIEPDELTEWIIREVYVRCSSCKGSGHEGTCECGGTGFDWSDTAATDENGVTAIHLLGANGKAVKIVPDDPGYLDVTGYKGWNLGG